MDEVLDYNDKLGPAKIIHVSEPTSGLKAILVIDNVATGPSIGGLRMAPDVTALECIRLARAMTLKNAAAGLPHGGGKSVLFGDPKMQRDKKERLIRGLACALESEKDYIFGPDMGTDERCMAWIRDEIGRAVGLPRAVGGIPLDEIGATGWGVSHAVDVALDYCNFDLNGARLVVQGFGAVGKHSARFLTSKGAVLTAVNDSKGAIYNQDGLDLDELMRLKTEGRCVNDYPQGQKLERDQIIDVECDIWIPAARPDVIREENVNRLKAQLVVEGANIPVTPGAERILHERGILCVPDFIANAGGVICAAMEYQQANQTMAMQTIEEKLRVNTAEVLEVAKQQRVPPRDAAVALATERVKQAMRLKRWSIF